MTAQAYGSIITEIGEVSIPDDVTTEKLIRAGKYSYVNRDITSENFPITCWGARKLFLMQLTKEAECYKVQKEVMSLGNKRLALTGDLLALGAHDIFREVMRRAALVICLGSVHKVRDCPRALFLFNRGNAVGLDLKFFYDKCRIDYRVLLVDAPLPSK
ncbi:MAG: hypothetical protein A3G57_03070 [Candidatus Andersenbacteria bacterium RIFCSPLOWO2_12_FULL_45_8]|nr:MAG: hypothetical protein UW94_C0002G0054 [Parcubacteria group bacterium GW2011_GWA2_45_14]OGY33516.1 MAG: hypothetical protein A3B76_05690 [Candidatus Andersenbacteria bacterium RIFCSPHIGHO2_02_FULL_46_16]OGY36338.1 MAG: hypothetical protein A3I08_04440 [Candidatus Andersenbacteria bacterium RIFCSPLOWO2_02_FULL_46_11]OGY39125.1 MAG: hypothetical protein A3G57_03070 [Candidatus Andersenbacteria bacterium RIFCSPLOWO2_12_FULL_45_8]HBE90324.1 hypothetical protein [Candidatus Andersenbacteria ba